MVIYMPHVQPKNVLVGWSKIMLDTITFILKDWFGWIVCWHKGHVWKDIWGCTEGEYGYQWSVCQRCFKKEKENDDA